MRVIATLPSETVHQSLMWTHVFTAGQGADSRSDICQFTLDMHLIVVIMFICLTKSELSILLHTLISQFYFFSWICLFLCLPIHALINKMVFYWLVIAVYSLRKWVLHLSFFMLSFLDRNIPFLCSQMCPSFFLHPLGFMSCLEGSSPFLLKQIFSLMQRSQGDLPNTILLFLGNTMLATVFRQRVLTCWV